MPRRKVFLFARHTYTPPMIIYMYQVGANEKTEAGAVKSLAPSHAANEGQKQDESPGQPDAQPGTSAHSTPLPSRKSPGSEGYCLVGKTVIMG